MLLNGIVSWITLLLLHTWGSEAYPNATELKRSIFAGYDNQLRPSCPGQETVNVDLDAAIRQILSLDEPTQELVTKMWMRMNWVDCRLSWNPREAGIDHIVVQPAIIWVPDITLYESTDGDMYTEMGDYRVLIGADGHVSYLWPIILRSFCKLKVTYFPFDKQVCDFTFGSWRYGGGEVDFWNVSEKGDDSRFKQSAEWHVISYDIDRVVTYYKCCPEPFVTLTFKLGLYRRPLFYIICLIVPCILVAALTILGFLLPVDSGEKVSLQITVMLSLSVFLLVIQETLPPSSDSAPILGLYFASTMVLVTFSCVITVVVIFIHFKTKTRVPGWAKKYLLGTMAKVMCIGGNEDHSSKVPSCISTQCKRSRFHNLKAWVKRFRVREDEPRENGKVPFHDITADLKNMNETLTQPKNNESFTNGGLSLSDESLSVSNSSVIISNGGITTENQGDGDGLQTITVIGERRPILKHSEIRSKGSYSIFGEPEDLSSSPKNVHFGSKKSNPRPIKSIDIKCKCSGEQEESLRNIARHYTEEGYEEERAEEWHRLANVIDRFCFFLTLLFMVSVTSGVFIQYTTL